MASNSLKMASSSLKMPSNSRQHRSDEDDDPISTAIDGDFTYYKSIRYREPYLVLVDRLFLEKYVLLDTESAFKALQTLLGGRFILGLTDCVSRNYKSKHHESLHLDNKVYPCGDLVSDTRNDFDCMKHLVKEKGLAQQLILATGNHELKRLMCKYSYVPIIFFDEFERELVFLAHTEKRYQKFLASDETRNSELLEKGVFSSSSDRTVWVLVDEGFIVSGMKDDECIELFEERVSEVLGAKAEFITSSCCFKRSSRYLIDEPVADKNQEPEKKNYISNTFQCGHKHPRPSSDNCVVSMVEDVELAIRYVATTSDILSEKLSKISLITVLGISEDGEIILNKPAENEEVLGGASFSSHKRNKMPALGNESSELPERLSERPCLFYMKTGVCAYGSNCKFIHPKFNSQGLPIRSYALRNEGPLPERPSELPCSFYMKTGVCAYGSNCKFNHPKFNSQGLPIRPGEADCRLYLNYSSCDYGATCRYNHPERNVSMEDLQEAELDQVECHHYMRTGTCKFGERCYYRHPLDRTSHAGLSRRKQVNATSDGFFMSDLRGASSSNSSLKRKREIQSQEAEHLKKPKF